ncbi:MAG: putative murein peptide carboxypeptidase [Chlamydiae bacterium]|nr:putative murein peptide carboxypeptidase [Chlamydiota bacterium]
MLTFTFLSAEPRALFPPPLQKGDLIAIVFPGSFLNNRKKSKEAIERKIEWLKERGYRTVLYPVKVNPVGQFAGTDKERAVALMNAWKNDKVKAIWCYRGGYGACRVLDLIDYEWIKSHPKILLGMSDTTALHYAVQQKTGLVTFLAPSLNFFDHSYSKFDDDYSFSELEKVVSGEAVKSAIGGREARQVDVICSGKAEGGAVGGNLSVITSLCGTKWQLDTKGKVLILEDVGESVYKIDRMLWQIKEAGLLKSPAGIILGTWKECKNTMAHSLSLEEVFKHYFGNANYPVVVGFPTGHGDLQTTIPLNARIKIDTSSKQTVKLLEAAVQ